MPGVKRNCGKDCCDCTDGIDIVHEKIISSLMSIGEKIYFVKKFTQLIHSLCGLLDLKIEKVLI